MSHQIIIMHLVCNVGTEHGNYQLVLKQLEIKGKYLIR